MPKNILFSFFVLVMFFTLNVNLFSQQCELTVTNINFESTNSLTFDVFVENTGSSSMVYSHGSLVWTYDTAILNGGTPTFSLVPGFSDFAASAYPPSALITSPNILRTSSNLPGSNGVIQAGENLRLYRFRLQTSAISFASNFFSINWKNSVTPYTRIFTWDSGTGLPSEVQNVSSSILQLTLDENFDYGTVANPDLLAVTTNWVRHSGAQGPAYLTTSLSYSSYSSSGIGGSAWFTRGASGVNDGDVNRVFPTPFTSTDNIYATFLVKIDSARATSDYFFHLAPDPIGTIFRGRVFGRNNGTGWSLGLSKSTEAAVNDNTILNFGQTYLVVLKYSFSSVTTSDDIVTLYVYESGIPLSEPGSPLLTIGPTGSGTGSDPANIGAVAIRQGTNTPTGVLDGIRIGNNWSEIFPPVGSPLINVSPSILSGFTYFVGGGPSPSQSYNLSGSSLTPASGNITVTGSTNYEVSLNNSTFTGSVNVAYSGGTLTATPIYVRLKAGLLGGTYNGELIANSGGGATTQNVTCNGSVVKSEPTNHVTSFAGVLGIPSYYSIILNWIDAAGGTTPDGYLIKGSSFNYDSIKVPIDGTPENNSLFVQNVLQGVQTKTFGFNSATTYYFKIFPYSNSGPNINYKIDGTVPQFSIATNSAPSLPLTENFEYVTGTFLTDNGWLAHSGAGTNPIPVNDLPLSYPGYINSGLGKSVTMTTSGEDDNRAFNSVTSGSLYASFMVNFTSAQTGGDYFFHMGPENTTSLFYAKVFVKKNAGDSLAIGVAKRNNTDVLYTTFSYALNTTYLIAVKYTFNAGSTTDDEVKLWVNPVLDGIEPAATLTQTDLGEDALSLGMLALRQGGTTTAAALTLGGIRIANTWIPETGSTTFQLTVNVSNGWNMVSIPGLHPTDQNVSTWWAFRDLGANVFRYAGGYQSITDAVPGTGYWMKHSGDRTYNTGDEWPAGGINIVPHVPIAGASGWNLIGGYELSVTAANVTTNPPGLQSGSIFQYSGGYQVATTLNPGYGYWIKLNAAGQIIIPETMAKGSATEYFPDDWGRIIISDATGTNYTLYSVKGEVDLSQYDLPPAPPAGMFDIRYSSGRIAEDINSSIKTIDMSGVTYPLTVRVENMDIRLMDESGKMINVNLKAGEDVVIADASVMKLMVSGELIPAQYALEQNYPNPFNPSTVIEFSLPEDVANVKLSIYNALGEKVAELVNTALTAGKYQYQWNAQNVATGMYIYELRTDKFVSVKKMVLVK
ncbi:MAG TPA: T9SS type A sorting domain-containing protein [Ignavibacteriaceae bacterium]|nr:T9SS type A sorting domain-containing protein [Ignavibacteriaceae bacterium]